MIKLNKIYNENCLDTMSRMNDNFIDLTVTSPPYDNLRTYDGYFFDFKSIAKELFRVTKVGGVVVWIVGDSTRKGSETGTSFNQALYFKQIGFNLHDTMIYSAKKMVMNHNRYEQEFEYMFIFAKGKPKTFNPIMIPTKQHGAKKRANDGKKTIAKLEKNDTKRFRDEKWKVKPTKIKGNIWEYSIGFNGTTKDKIAFEHPAIFPEKLANDHIISWSNENDIVYDCFGGSGTTAKMSIVNNRNYIISEISKGYCDDIIKPRINDAIQERDTPNLFS